jgi:MalT-like TPR region
MSTPVWSVCLAGTLRAGCGWGITRRCPSEGRIFACLGGRGGTPTCYRPGVLQWPFWQCRITGRGAFAVTGEEPYELAASQGRVGSLIEIQALQALALAASGDERGALAALAEALALAWPEGYLRVFVTRAQRWPAC